MRFQYPNITMDRSQRQKINKKMLSLNHTLDQMNKTFHPNELNSTYKTFHPTVAEYTCKLLNTFSDFEQHFLLPRVMLQGFHTSTDYLRSSKLLVESDIFQLISVYKEVLAKIKMWPYHYTLNQHKIQCQLLMDSNTDNQKGDIKK